MATSKTSKNQSKSKAKSKPAAKAKPAKGKVAAKSKTKSKASAQAKAKAKPKAKVAAKTRTAKAAPKRKPARQHTPVAAKRKPAPKQHTPAAETMDRARAAGVEATETVDFDDTEVNPVVHADDDSPDGTDGVQGDLQARHMLTVSSRAAAAELPPDERPRFLAAMRDAIGLDAEATFAEAIEKLDSMRMGFHKLQLRRGDEPVFDVWINTGMDDGAVLIANSDRATGIGISQTRVYDMTEHRDAQCAAIAAAIYETELELPEFTEWS